MAVRTITEFSNIYLTPTGQWPDNITGEITPSDLRVGITDTWDTMNFINTYAINSSGIFNSRINNSGAYSENVSGILNTYITNTSGQLNTRINNSGAYAANVSGILNTYITNTSGDLNTRLLAGNFNNVTATGTISGYHIIESGIRLAQGLYTGLISGGEVTQDGLSGIIIASGNGMIIDHITNSNNPIITPVSWNQLSGIYISDLTAKFTQIAITSSGTIYQKANSEFTSTEHRTVIPLATILTPNGSINGIQAHVRLTWDVAGYTTDLVHAIGPITVEGNVFSASGASLSLNKTAGSTFNLGVNYYNSSASPNITTDIEISGVTFQYKYKNSNGGYTTTAPRTTIIPGSYDDGDGTLGSVGNSEWTVQRIYYAPITNKVFIHYGQAKYATLAAAKDGIFSEVFTPDPVLHQYNTLRCFLLVRGNTTNLSDTTNNAFIEVNKFGAPISTSVSTTSLQQSYSNSSTPEITTDSVRGALTVIEGAGVGNNLYDGKDQNGNTSFYVSASGNLMASGIVILPKASGKGIMVDTANPTYGWKDILGNLTTAQGGAHAPTWGTWSGNLYAWSFDNATGPGADELMTAFHIPHDYAPGTVIYPHVHWCPSTNATGKVVWGFEYSISKGHQQQVYSPAVTVYATGVIAAGSGQAHRHYISEVTNDAVIPATNIEVDGLIIMRVFRQASTYTDNVFAHYCDLHYQSTHMPTKNKAPNFYS